MLQKLIGLLKTSDLRKKALIIIALLLVFRLMATIPLPQVNHEKLVQFFEANQIFGLFNIFTGGALSKISIAFLGIGPYITASIIMQLLTIVFPNLKELFYEGTDKERAQFEQYTRLLTIPLAALQSLGFLSLLRSQGVITIGSPFDLIRNIIIATASSIILMWFGELITEQKLGNGISLIIFSGIVVNLPRQFFQTFVSLDPTRVPNLIVFLAMSLLIVLGIVIVARGERRIKVNYAKQVRGTKIYGGSATYLPMRVNQAGMIPIIFAMSILMFPQLIGQFLARSQNAIILKIVSVIKDFGPNSWAYLVFYFLLVVFFTFFYTSITFEPDSLAENLQKRGGFVPGYRPGKTTSQFLSAISRKVTLFGAIFLGLIAILPIILQRITGITTMAISGASLIIMVEVAIETMRAIEAQLIIREYEKI